MAGGKPRAHAPHYFLCTAFSYTILRINVSYVLLGCTLIKTNAVDWCAQCDGGGLGSILGNVVLMAGVVAMICAVVLRRAALLDESVESERVRLVARDCALVLMVSVCAFASSYACTADTIFSYYAEAVGVLVCAFIFVFLYAFFFDGHSSTHRLLA